MKRVGVLALVPAALVAYLWLPALGPPSASALNISLTERAEGLVLINDLYPCVKRGARRYTCEIRDSRGWGLVLYSVSLDERCWRARRLTEGTGPPGVRLPQRFEGCVSLRDQMRPVERIL